MMEKTEKILEVFQRVVSHEAVQRLTEIYPNQSWIFTPYVTLWLMLLQRVSADKTLEEAVESLCSGPARMLLSEKAQSKKISTSTGGYSQARSRLEIGFFEELLDLQAEVLAPQCNQLWNGYRVMLVDGTTSRLPCNANTAEEFPPGRNQRRKSNWGTMFIAVAHELFSGVAYRPEIGPMYGKNAVGEVALTIKLLERLAPNSIIIGDKAYGIFWFAYEAAQAKHEVVIRLTESRVKRLLEESKENGEVLWTPSSYELKAHPELPADASVKGRLVVVELKHGRAPEKLYLFTTLSPEHDVASLYKERWKVEQDIRYIKTQLKLSELDVRSASMAVKELLMGIFAHNLIRQLMLEAAKLHQLAPRDFSFTTVRRFFLSFVSSLRYHLVENQHYQVLDELIERLKYAKLQRPKKPRPPYPRAILSKGKRFPYRSKHAN